MAKRKTAPIAPIKAKKASKKGKEITADFVRTLPAWEPMLTKDEVDELESRHTGSGDIAINRRIMIAAAARTHEQLLESWREEISEDGECKTMFSILEAIWTYKNCALGMLKIAEATHARILGAGILVDDNVRKQALVGSARA